MRDCSLIGKRELSGTFTADTRLIMLKGITLLPYSMCLQMRACFTDREERAESGTFTADTRLIMLKGIKRGTFATLWLG